MTHYLYKLALIALLPTTAYGADDVFYECETLVEMKLDLGVTDLTLPVGTTFNYTLYGTITGQIFAEEYVRLANGSHMRRTTIPVPEIEGGLPVVLISEKPDLPLPNGANSIAMYDNQARTFLTSDDLTRDGKVSAPINCYTVDGTS